MYSGDGDGDGDGDGSCLDPMFSGVSLQSLLSLNVNSCPLAESTKMFELRSPEAKRHRMECPVIPQSKLARQRRQKFSEKTRCLQKLMPWDKKMDQATLLQEAHKYVKFLQAQFRLLHSMPSHSPTFQPLQNAAVFGDLHMLNRTQLLQVLLNSPLAQTILYSQGFCVFSLEHLPLLTTQSPIPLSTITNYST